MGWLKRREGPPRVADTIKPGRLDRLPGYTLVAYLNTSLYETGRALTAYENQPTSELLDEVEHCAVLIPDLIAELRRRHA